MIRSYLYAPGSSPRIAEKAIRAGADAVVLDLEDAVAPGEKASARRAVAQLIERARDDCGAELHVRVNHRPGSFDTDDLAAVVAPGLSGLRLPKATCADEIRAVAELLDELEPRAGIGSGHIRLYATVESAAGALAATELACAPRVERLAFGATDFLADIGSPGSVDGPATLLARSALVLASRAANINAPIDTVYTRLDDEDGLRRSALSARELGFFGKSVIHPRQLAIVHEVFTPTAEDVERAQSVIEESEAAGARGVAATRLGGDFIDPAVVARARRVLEIAGANRKESDGDEDPR